jgi:group I intron endonuclease
VVAKVIWDAYLAGPSKEMVNRVVGKDKKCGIYRIADMKTQECYIGQGVDVGKRLTEHIKGTLGIQSIADQYVHRIMAEHGIENWTFELLEECDKDDLNSREKYYIAYYRSNEFGFNKT